MSARARPECVCPRCGANDTRELASSTRWGRTRVRRECRACGKRFSSGGLRRGETAPSSERPRYSFRTVSACPVCGKIGRVTSTRQAEGIRWWKCDACAETWKEVGERV